MSKQIFRIDIEESDTGFVAVVYSLEEKKGMSVRAPNVRLLLAEIVKQVKKRRGFLRRFPVSPIVKPSDMTFIEASQQILENGRR